MGLAGREMDAETRFWERIEGGPQADPEDAQHWVRVYSELLATLRGMEATVPVEGNRVGRLVAVIEERLGFWSGRLVEAPVREARRRGPAPARRRDTA